MSRIFIIRYDGSYLGGRAVVKAKTKRHAWEFLKLEYPSLEPLEQCFFREETDQDGVLYNWDGDY